MQLNTITAITIVACTAMSCLTVVTMLSPESSPVITGVGTIATLVIVGLLQLAKTELIGQKVEEVHLATNSLTDRLVETTKTEAHAAGVKEEVDRVKKEER